MTVLNNKTRKTKNETENAFYEEQIKVAIAKKKDGFDREKLMKKRAV